jgi:hypothetical protein
LGLAPQPPPPPPKASASIARAQPVPLPLMNPRRMTDDRHIGPDWGAPAPPPPQRTDHWSTSRRKRINVDCENVLILVVHLARAERRGVTNVTDKLA